MVDLLDTVLMDRSLLSASLSLSHNSAYCRKAVVVAHETVSMAKPMIAFVDMPERVQKAYAVLDVFKDGFFALPRDVM